MDAEDLQIAISTLLAVVFALATVVALCTFTDIVSAPETWFFLMLFAVPFWMFFWFVVIECILRIIQLCTCQEEEFPVLDQVKKLNRYMDARVRKVAGRNKAVAKMNRKTIKSIAFWGAVAFVLASIFKRFKQPTTQAE